MDLLIPLLTLIIGSIGLSWFAGSDAPFVPTDLKKVKSVLKMAGVKKGVIFYELGSGDGRVVLEASKLGADSHGVEQSWLRVWYSRYQARNLKLNCHFDHGNLFDRSYFPANVVYIYLLQRAVDKLEKKLKKELRKGSIIITQRYHFKKWLPFKKTGDFWIYKA